MRAAVSTISAWVMRTLPDRIARFCLVLQLDMIGGEIDRRRRIVTRFRDRGAGGGDGGERE